MSNRTIIHESRVGTYHPPPCPCRTECKHRGQDWHGVNNPDGSPARCPDCGYYVVNGNVICRCDAAWTINDTRGYLDGGPSCDECGACDCNLACWMTPKFAQEHACPPAHKPCQHDGVECIGLSFAYVNLNGGEALCESCARKAGIEVVPCSCAG